MKKEWKIHLSFVWKSKIKSRLPTEHKLQKSLKLQPRLLILCVSICPTVYSLVILTKNKNFHLHFFSSSVFQIFGRYFLALQLGLEQLNSSIFIQRVVAYTARNILYFFFVRTIETIENEYETRRWTPHSSRSIPISMVSARFYIYILKFEMILFFPILNTFLPFSTFLCFLIFSCLKLLVLLF